MAVKVFWVIGGGCEDILGDWGVVVGSCENILGDWGWLWVIGDDWG